MLEIFLLESGCSIVCGGSVLSHRARFIWFLECILSLGLLICNICWKQEAAIPLDEMHSQSLKDLAK